MQLFTDSIESAKNLIEITDQVLVIIIQARKTLLFQNIESWVKKLGTEDFNALMECYDGCRSMWVSGVLYVKPIQTCCE